MYPVSEEYKTKINSKARRNDITGRIYVRGGGVITLTNDNVAKGTLSIDRKISSGGKLDIGGVYASQLTCTFIGLDTSDLASARIEPVYRLWLSSEEYEDVPLGKFYVDNNSIRRVKGFVTLDALDGITKLDIAMPEDYTYSTLNRAVASAAGLSSLFLDIEEFELLPNAMIEISLESAKAAQVQTLRDIVMWAAQLTGSFAWVDRTGTLQFKRLQAFTDESNMVIPVREIQGDLRNKTSFADNTVRITKLIMRRDGKAISKRQIYGGAFPTENRMSLELKENPLIAHLSDSEVVDVLSNILSKANDGLSTALFRPFQTTFIGDPALDLGDYVRLRGGEIDTARGYGTGMITAYKWTFGGEQRLECNAQTSTMEDIGGSSSSSSSARMAVLASEEETEQENPQIQAKSQVEKRLDAVERVVYDKADNQSVEQEFESRKLTNINFLEDFKAELSYVDGTSKIYTGTLTDGKLTKVSDGEKQCTVALDSALDTIRANDKAFAIACAVGVGGEKPTEPRMLIIEFDVKSAGEFQWARSDSVADWVDYGNGEQSPFEATYRFNAGKNTFRVCGFEGNFAIGASSKLWTPSWLNGVNILPGSRLHHPVGKESLSASFYNCEMLISIPKGLFDDVANTKSVARMFYHCYNLVEIPDGIFENCPNISNFEWCFCACRALKVIPTDIFKNCNVGVYYNFADCFNACLGLSSIPQELFTNVPTPSNFSYCFSNYRGAGAVPALWVSHPTSVGEDCFKDAKNAANYADIPSDWK